MKEYKYTIDGKEYKVAIGDIVDNVADVTVNCEQYKVEMEPEKEPEKPKPVVRPAAPASAPASSESSPRANNQNAVKSPLPGVITEIMVSVGDEVSSGDTVVVLEAMKMANNLEAEKGGKVTAILVQPGQSVMDDDPLVVIE